MNSIKYYLKRHFISCYRWYYGYSYPDELLMNKQSYDALINVFKDDYIKSKTVVPPKRKKRYGIK